MRPRHSKYNAIPTKVDGFNFQSKLEARRYSELKLLEKAGEIRDLKLQPPFPIVWNGNRICTVLGDFRYIERSSGEDVVEDTKGYDTDLSRIKRKLVVAFYPHVDWRVVKR